jgi:formate-dependent nitrite reductase membrane component NrfD
MPDTFYTASPHWAWYIVWYFFVGGIAGGCFFIASLLKLFGRPEDAPVVRTGYYVAFAGALLSGLLLTLDLTRPERFWHMLIQSNTGRLMFKAWAPMSVGAWGLACFGLFAGLAAASEFSEQKNLSLAALRRLARGIPAMVIAGAGTVLGFFLAGYTGVLLAVTNRPVWADSNLLGLLFLVSGASTAAGTLILLGLWRGSADRSSLEWLSRFDRGALALELLVLIAFVASLGSVAKVFLGWWGALLVLGVLVAGIILPLFLEARQGQSRGTLVRAAALVLAGGLLLRIVVIFSSNQIHVAGSVVSP